VTRFEQNLSTPIVAQIDYNRRVQIRPDGVTAGQQQRQTKVVFPHHQIPPWIKIQTRPIILRDIGQRGVDDTGDGQAYKANVRGSDALKENEWPPGRDLDRKQNMLRFKPRQTRREEQFAALVLRYVTEARRQDHPARYRLPDG